MATKMAELTMTSQGIIQRNTEAALTDSVIYEAAEGTSWMLLRMPITLRESNMRMPDVTEIVFREQ